LNQITKIINFIGLNISKPGTGRKITELNEGVAAKPIN
jgi:hypothetical protein